MRKYWKIFAFIFFLFPCTLFSQDIWLTSSNNSCDDIYPSDIWITSCYDVIFSDSALLVNAGSDQVICADSTATMAATSSNQDSVVWSSVMLTGTFDDDNSLTAVFTPSNDDKVLRSGYLRITAYKDISFLTDSLLIDIDPVPIITLDNNDTIYAGSTYSITDAVIQNYNDYYWSTLGDGVYNDSTIINPVYTHGSSDETNGSVTLVSHVSNCSCGIITDTIELIIEEIP
jgi:hypothetical protein